MNKVVKIILLTVYILTQQSLNAQSITWQRLYNGQSNYYDNGRGICKSTDNSIYITGFVLSGSAVVLKLKPNGDTIWTKNFEGLLGYFILPTSDGGCIITGRSPLVYTLKLDSSGNTVWFKTYKDGTYITTTDFIKTSEGGYAISGYQTGVLPGPAYILLLDSLGNLIWQKYFYAGYIKEFLSITQTIKSSFILSGGSINCETCGGNPFLIEINNKGDSLWEKKYNLFADFVKIYTTTSGYLIGGTILDSPYVFANSFIMNVNFRGDIEFKKNLTYNNRETLKDIRILNSNKYVIACDTDTLNRRSAGVYIVDSFGNVLNRNIFYITDYSLFFSILPLQNNDIVFSGTVNTYLSTGRDIYAVRTDSTLFAKPLGIKNKSYTQSKDYNLFQNYPNPFNPETKIRYNIQNIHNNRFQIKIYNLLGKEIKSYEIIDYPSGEIIVNINNLSTGIYYYSLVMDDSKIETKKMIYLK